MNGDTDREAAFLDRAKALLDQRADELDARTLARLQGARRAVLESRPHSTGAIGRPAIGRMIWAGGLATATVAVVAGSLWLLQPATQAPAGALEDLDLLTASETLDFYEDLEFYGWLVESDGTHAADPTG